MKASGKKAAAKMKAAGKGIFKVRTLSAALTAITGKSRRALAVAITCNFRLRTSRQVSVDTRYSRSFCLNSFWVSSLLLLTELPTPNLPSVNIY